MEGILLLVASSLPAHNIQSPFKSPSLIFRKGNRYRGHCFKPFEAKRAQLHMNSHLGMPLASTFDKYQQDKLVWIWTKSKQVMTAAVERAIALICPFLIDDGVVTAEQSNKRIATYFEISSPEQLQELQLESIDHQAENVVLNLQDWQVIPAENIIAAFRGRQKTVFAVAETPSEAQTFLEALEQGLGGVVLKVEDIEAVIELKGYFDKRNEAWNVLNLTKATITRIQTTGMGDRVCVDLCNLMRPGEGLLVGSFARGLFLVHSECLESNYISSRPFRVNAGPVHAYVAIPGGKTSYLSELQAGKEVIVVDQNGRQRTAIVGRVKIESRPLILVEAMSTSDCKTNYSILLQNAETVGLVRLCQGDESRSTAIAVTSLKVGDEVMLRVQGGARHTGIEIQEFIIEK